MAGFYTKRPFSARSFCNRDRVARRGEASHCVWTVADTEGTVEVFVHQHAAAGKSSPKRR
jgi:hypothetical protein